MRQELMLPQNPEASLAAREDVQFFSRQFGRRIMRLRRRKEWSQTDLAQRLGVSRERLAKWESGINEPPLVQVERLGDLLGVSLDELISGTRTVPGLTRADQNELVGQLEAVLAWLGKTTFD